MKQHRAFAVLAALSVFACTDPRLAEPVVEQRVPTPPAHLAKAFETCSWGPVHGLGLSLYSYACGPDRANMRLVVDESLPGFAIERTDHGGMKTLEPAVQLIFRKADEPIEAIAANISSMSPALEGDDCRLLPAGAGDPRPADGRVRYVWAPIGEVKKRWEAANDGGQAMPPPCGALGVQHRRITTFEILKDDPTTVIAVRWENEPGIFDPSTIRSIGPNAS